MKCCLIHQWVIEACSLAPIISVLKTINVNRVIKMDNVREDVSAENASPSVPTHVLRTGELPCSGAQPTSLHAGAERVICHENNPMRICRGLLITFAFLISLPWLRPSALARGSLCAVIMKALPPLRSSRCLLSDQGRDAALRYSVISSMVFLLYVMSLDAAVK